MKTTRAAAISAAAVLAGILGASAASAAPPAPWLPDADLFCPGDTAFQGDWVTAPGSDSLWVDDGPLAGHYVLLAFSHYRMTGLQTAPPDSYAGLEQLDNVVRGAKTGLAGNAITCQFVSRWDLPGTADDFSVVGPVTMVKVSP